MAGIEYPQNDFTRMIEEVARDNAGGRRPVVASATPGPSVTTPAMREPRVEEAPLSAEESAELDALARAHGVVDPRLGNAPGQNDHGLDPTTNKYANMTMEQILAEGSPVHTPPVVVRQEAPVRMPGMRVGVVSSAPIVQPPRLPNFRNVQGIDLIIGVVYVDDMPFAISTEELAEFRKFAVEVARADIMSKLDEALDLVTQATAEAVNAEGGNEA
jgi:hypothetical protein